MSIGNAGVAARIAKDASSPKPLHAFLRSNFYFSMSLVLTALVLWGFSHTVDAALFHANPPRPLLLWIHGAAFSIWMIFLIAQSALVRTRNVSVHRLLGWFGAALASVMVVLGLVIAIIMGRFDTVVLHQKDAPAFLAIPFADMLTFGPCIALAIYWRKKPEYHRRLIFIATCALMDAAFGRFDFLFNHNLFYPALDLLVVLGMLRDWRVDGRVHKVYLYALPSMILIQIFAVYLWRFNPAWWHSTTSALLGL